MPLAKETKHIRWEEWFYYDETSPTCLRNAKTRSNSVKGAVAGYLNKSVGYYRVKFKNESYPLHRIIYELLNGGLSPVDKVDHIDGDRLNNRADNLRKVDETTNQRNKKMYRNNKTGVTGVALWEKDGLKYYVSMCYDDYGKMESTYFSVAKLGEYEAFAQAVAHRGKYLQTAAHFTPRHGQAV